MDLEAVNDARDLTRRVVDFIETGQVDSLDEEEIKHYFRMCHQVEIYYQKFAKSGSYISFEPATGFVLDVEPNQSPRYDLSRLADKFFAFFCRPLVPPTIMAQVARAFTQEFGSERYIQCLRNLTEPRDDPQPVEQMEDGNYSFYGFEFIKGYMALSESHDGFNRVESLLTDLINEDDCSVIVVGIFAARYPQSARLPFKIKTMLFSLLNFKYEAMPRARMWIEMLKSPDLVKAINNFAPLLDFILSIIIEVSARPNWNYNGARFNRDDLVAVMFSLHENPSSKQKSMDVMFDQYRTEDSVWGTVISACGLRKPPLKRRAM